MSDPRDVTSKRLPAERYAQNFDDLHAPLTPHQAAVESDRCYFCFDAPCTLACPTGIDIPGFIQKIRSDNLVGSAHTILDANIFGATCARVCPVETLCEAVCVRNVGEEKPVTIGALQRYATDHLLARGTQVFQRQPSTGKCVAVVGGGPAGLSCAHRLAMLGHDVVVHEARAKLGGLNEFGIAAYKMTDDIAQREIDYLLDIGGIEVRTNSRLGHAITLEQLRAEYPAVFLGIGLGDVRTLGLADEAVPGVIDAVRYIEQLRQTDDLSSLPVGRRVVVIGGGMTAIDIAMQTHLLGAEEVTLVYRGTPERMGASQWERELAQTHGIKIRYNARPLRVMLANGEVAGMEFDDAQPSAQGSDDAESCTIPADMVFKAIGQSLVADPLDDAKVELLDTSNGRLMVDVNRRTSLRGVWAGGDCIGLSQDLTVSAVEDGKLAAHDIDSMLRQQQDEAAVAHSGATHD